MIYQHVYHSLKQKVLYVDQMVKDLKGSCWNLYMRGPVVENVSQTVESDVVNYLKR